MNVTSRSREIITATLCEAGLLLIAGLAALTLHKPLLFASLGPTAYELVETPERKTARPYSILAGHLIAVLCGFAALALTQAWNSPPVSSGNISFARVTAAVVSALLTVALTLLFKAMQPAAVSTTLLITSGTMQAPADAYIIMASIVLITIIGEPVRRWRLAQRTAAG